MNPSLDWLKGFLLNPNMAWFFSWFPVDVPPVFGIRGVPPFSHLAIYTLSSLVEQTTPMALRFFDEVASVSEIRRVFFRVLLGSSYWFLMKISLLWLEIQYYDSATKMNLDRIKYIKFHPMMHYQSLWSLHNQVYLLYLIITVFSVDSPCFWAKPSWLSAITIFFTNDSIISGQILLFLA